MCRRCCHNAGIWCKTDNSFRLFVGPQSSRICKFTSHIKLLFAAHNFLCSFALDACPNLVSQSGFFALKGSCNWFHENQKLQHMRLKCQGLNFRIIGNKCPHPITISGHHYWNSSIESWKKLKTGVPVIVTTHLNSIPIFLYIFCSIKFDIRNFCKEVLINYAIPQCFYHFVSNINNVLVALQIQFYVRPRVILFIFPVFEKATDFEVQFFYTVKVMINQFLILAVDNRIRWKSSLLHNVVVGSVKTKLVLVVISINVYQVINLKADCFD